MKLCTSVLLAASCNHAQLPQMKVGSSAYGGDVIDHGQMTVYDDIEVAGRVNNLD